MTLWIATGLLVALTTALYVAAWRSAVRLVKLAHERYPDALGNEIAVKDSGLRQGFRLARAVNELDQKISRDPSLVSLLRVRNLTTGAASILSIPAIYCLVVTIGKLVSE